MEPKQIQIIHYIKELAEQFRIIDRTGTMVVGGIVGASRERAKACRVASKAISQLERLGIGYEIAYHKAKELNESLLGMDS